MKKLLYLSVFLTCFTHQSIAQNWMDMMNDPQANFYDTKAAFDTWWADRSYEKGNGYNPFKRWERFMEQRIAPDGRLFPPYQAWVEYQNFMSQYRPDDPVMAMRSAGWSPLGPDSVTVKYGARYGLGRVNVVVMHPSDTNVLFIGTPAGGMWKSPNGGVDWIPLTDNIPVMGVSAIAIDPDQPDTMYIATGDGDVGHTYSIGVLKTVDGGQNWTVTGLSWQVSSYIRLRRLLIDPTNHNILHAAGTYGLYRSTDAGASWTQTMNGDFNDIEFKPGNSNTLYATGRDFYKSTDGGLTWTQVATGLPITTDVNRAEIGVTIADTNYVYVLYGTASNHSFYGIYLSSNGGNSFALRSNSPNIFGYSSSGSSSGGQSWYDMALAVSPTNRHELFVGGINVWRSTSGGLSWALSAYYGLPPTTYGYVHADIHSLGYFNGSIYCGSDGGVYKNPDHINTWIDLSAGLGIMEFYRMNASWQNPYKIMGGTQDNGTNYLSGGLWEHIMGGDGGQATFDPSNDQIMYAESQNGTIYRSVNGGSAWHGIKPFLAGAGAFVTPYAIDPGRPSNIYMGFTDVWKSNDYGDNWVNLTNWPSSGGTIRNLVLAASDTNYIYYSTTLGFKKSTDNGQTWTNVTNPTTFYLSSITVHPDNPQELWVTNSGFNAGQKVYHSTDGGQNWTNISGNLPNLPINCLEFQSGTAGLYVGTDVGVYYTDTSLANWQPFMTGLPNVIVNDLEIHYGLNKIRAATKGRGIWESNLFTPSSYLPIARFLKKDARYCSGDSVKFINQSVNAGINWQWYFPGGSPTASTAQSPEVVYPSPGLYNVTLIATNTNGSDTVTQQLLIDYGHNFLALHLQFDNHAFDNTWVIYDSSGTLIASGGSYDGLNNQLLIEHICLDNGCYDFTIYDQLGDGMCCIFGNGYYELRDSANTVLGSGSSTFSSQTVSFCFNSIGPLYINAVSVTDAGCGNNDGQLVMGATGGTGNYAYSIDGGLNFQSSNVFNNLAAGNYITIVMDSLGSSDTLAATVNQPAAPVAAASSDVNVTYLNQGGTVNFFSSGSINSNSYLWDFGDGSSSNQPNPAHNYSNAGIYTVILTTTFDNCTDSDTIYIQVDLNNALSTVAQHASIEIFPNPFEEKFQLNIALSLEKDIEISIHDLLGRKVYWNAPGQVRTYSELIHFGNQASGVYIVTVRCAEGAWSRKFVKKK